MIQSMRFAPVIRVSTEGQEKKGESLRTQETQIKGYVKSLKGTIPDHCWGYVGQEHATPNRERKKLDRLLTDSGKGLFDAVIVCDASRWSRDNLKSKEGLETLRKNNIRFFVGPMEYDLYNPHHTFFLGMYAEMGELQAKDQSLRSIQNRIHRAKSGRAKFEGRELKGLPTAGKKPWGRIWNKETQMWGIDKEKKKVIEQAAKRYLAGESIVAIATTYNMNFTNLWKILNHRCGDKWTQSFRPKDLNIDETVTIEIPRLLPEETIAAIHERARANKTYTHGEIKHRYLLSRMIFCAECGYTLFGQTNHNTKRYYRHPRYRKKACHWNKWVPADLIESSVLIHLVQTLGDPLRIQKAIQKANPNTKELQSLREERKTLSEELQKNAGRIDNVVDMVADGLLSKDEVKKRMEKLRERDSAIQARLSTIEELLENAPDLNKIKALSRIAALDDAIKNLPDRILQKPYENQRGLVEAAFAGTDTKKQRLGVYVSETGDKDQPWKFEIRGVLEKALLGLPLPDEYLEEAFGLHSDEVDVKEELRKIREAISSFTLP